MSDYISREVAIEQIKKEWAKLPLSKTTGFAILMRVLRKIPAADVVERKRGRWERLNTYYEPLGISPPPIVYCSECRLVGYWEPNFCPQCGADMRGDS